MSICTKYDLVDVRVHQTKSDAAVDQTTVHKIDISVQYWICVDTKRLDV